VRIRERLANKRPVFSFEFFPPKTELGEAVLWRSLRQLAALGPDFVSVTYGAGGSTRDRSLEITRRIKHEVGIEPMAHLTCVGHSRDELARVVEDLVSVGVENVLALRGDPPRGQTSFERPADGFGFASELVAFLRARFDVCIGAAYYPETHVEASSPEADLRHLREKVDAGADFLVSQLFFDNSAYFDFEVRARSQGIAVPMIAGLMPVTNVAQIERFTQMCGATIPRPLAQRLQEVADDPQETFWAGVSWAAHQARGLLHPAPLRPFEPARLGAPGIHFYTLNKSPATRAIFEILQLSRGWP
jgi:methylenetetrahydrofolate reductase (NADPH)